MPVELKKITIRSAVPQDAVTLARLRWDFRTREKEPIEDRDEFLERCERWMRERLASGNLWQCWIAELNGEPVGNLWLDLIEKIPNPAPEAELHAYITNFYVLEKMRGRRIGSQLLEIALEWCRERQVHAAILWPSTRSRPLYERHGFAVRDDLLELIVSSESS